MLSVLWTGYLKSRFLRPLIFQNMLTYRGLQALAFWQLYEKRECYKCSCRRKVANLLYLLTTNCWELHWGLRFCDSYLWVNESQHYRLISFRCLQILRVLLNLFIQEEDTPLAVFEVIHSNGGMRQISFSVHCRYTTQFSLFALGQLNTLKSQDLCSVYWIFAFAT